MKKIEQPNIPYKELKRLRELIRSVAWRESSTYHGTWKHAYILGKNVPLAVAYIGKAIKTYGYIDHFKGEPNHYLVVDDHKYWYYEGIVNREHVSQTLARQ